MYGTISAGAAQPGRWKSTMTLNNLASTNSNGKVIDSFITATYNCFLISLLGMVLFGFVGFNLLPKSWFTPICIVDGLLWVLCGWFGWRNPILIVFSLFIIFTGTSLGLTALHYAESGKSAIFTNAAMLTISVFVVLSIYVHITKRNFSGLIGFLIAGFWILLIGFFIYAFTGTAALHVGLSVFGAVVFCGWILFGTSRIISRWDPDIDPITAAFELFLDIIGLFSYMLDLRNLADD